jgi:hypothetical protein
MIIPPQNDDSGYWNRSQELRGTTQSFKSFLDDLAHHTMPVAHLIFSDGKSIGSIEKGFEQGLTTTSDTILAVINHDKNDPDYGPCGDKTKCGVLTRHQELISKFGPVLPAEQVVQLVDACPPLTKRTFFATIMDPSEGTIAWSRYWSDSKSNICPPKDS